MRIQFQCENCLKNTEFSEGTISLICQQCGCQDIKFSQDVLATPADPGDENAISPVLVKAKEPFFSKKKTGSIWEIKAYQPPEILEEKEEEKAEEVEKTPVVLKSRKRK